MLHGMPRPAVDHDTAPFWAGCANEEFLVPTCAANGHHRWPPGPMCPWCQDTETIWTRSSGHGVVYSWVTVTHPVDPVLVDQVPYVLAMIELPEGVRVVGNVAGCTPDEVYAGQPVTVYFSEPNAEGNRIPNWRVTEDSDGS
jgi:uncharacterized protein